MERQVMIIVLASLVAVLLLKPMTTDALEDAHLDELWTRFKQMYDKVYNDEEDLYRRQVLAANVEYINLHNIWADLGQHSFTLGVNEYSDLDNTCRFKSSCVGATCEGINYVLPREDENALMAAVAIGPVSVCIDASSSAFRYYKHGIFDEPNSTSVNHAVLVVGYGTEQGRDYWLVKNSWGTSWGENGYIRMSRNKGNQCFIASYASYPIV